MAEPVQQQITLVDENGDEALYDVLFTFESEDFNRSYIFIYPTGKANDEEIEISAYAMPKGDDPADPQGGELQAIESEEEWDMVESVLNTFLGEDEEDSHDHDEK
ncbi:DUF1292 domain-containing protein [Lentilactobacillus laojiaonis]|uniref:DUF1292 domain-containing protein n=1 Tax=Lentilactobacillus laojiaonis TaxID=2883998 RepID=UPI001D0AAD99|nr:DUF1292 domain-containing protein [Lentilactobacillus laojiaonis]UDM31702.1 DUF1292 domain-containing protein [Lentilactobacillus laojiaonis]